jgi:hypothetical protein
MHGGKRNGAGRPKGAISLRTRAFLEAAASGGELPLAYMLRVMRDEDATSGRRDRMARAAAPYLYPRLSSLREEDAEDAAPVSEAETVEPPRVDH